ncbi:MAG: GNAT family N-acetyltransferase [Clostridium sp.]
MDIIKDYQVESFSNLIADRFINDPRIVYTLDGIENKKEFLKKFGESQILAFSKDGYIRGVGEGEGIIIGYNKKEIGWFKLFKSMIKGQSILFKSISKDEKQRVINNGKKLKKFTDMSWYKKAVNTKGYFHILTIAVREDLKGQGIFRKLITPIIEECNKNNLCIVLETNSSDTLPIYEHFGFKIYETIKSDKIDLLQYSMIKYPSL